LTIPKPYKSSLPVVPRSCAVLPIASRT
jgi:hypothetical protein